MTNPMTKPITAAAKLAEAEAAYNTAVHRYQEAAAAIGDADAERVRVQTAVTQGGEVTTQELIDAPATADAARARHLMIEPAVAGAWSAVLTARAEAVREEVSTGSDGLLSAAQLRDLIDREAVKVATAARRIEALADASNAKLEQLWWTAKDSAAVGGDHARTAVVRSVEVLDRSGNRVLRVNGVEHQALNSYDLAEQIGARAGILAA